MLDAIDLGTITPAQRFINIERGITSLNDKFDRLCNSVDSIKLKVIVLTVSLSGIVSAAVFLLNKFWP